MCDASRMRVHVTKTLTINIISQLRGRSNIFRRRKKISEKTASRRMPWGNFSGPVLINGNWAVFFWRPFCHGGHVFLPRDSLHHTPNRISGTMAGKTRSRQPPAPSDLYPICDSVISNRRQQPNRRRFSQLSTIPPICDDNSKSRPAVGVEKTRWSILARFLKYCYRDTRQFHFSIPNMEKMMTGLRYLRVREILMLALSWWLGLVAVLWFS